MRAAVGVMLFALLAQPEPQKIPEPRMLNGGVRLLARQVKQSKRPGRCVTSVVRPELRGLASAQVEAALNRELKLRRTPRLEFVYDRAVEHGVRMTHLIDELAPDDGDGDATE